MGSGSNESIVREYIRKRTLPHSAWSRGLISISGVFLGNLIVTMYGACGSLEEAREMFERMKLRNVTSWNIILSAYARSGHSQEAFNLYKAMDIEGFQANQSTFTSLAYGCGASKDIASGILVHEEIINTGMKYNVAIGTSLVDMYGKCGYVDNAKFVFDGMVDRDVVTWTALLATYAQNGFPRNAKQVFDEMPEKNFVSWTAMITAYAKASQVQDAFLVFDKMPQRNVVTWNAMIAAYAQNELSEKALALFLEMDIEGIEANAITYTSVIEACNSKLHIGKIIHKELTCKSSIFFELPAVAIALLSLYGKYGCMEEAESVFYKMPQCNQRVCNSMISVYGMCGYSLKAEELFSTMPKRNVVSWNSLIAAYTHAGKMVDAKRIFDSMVPSERNTVSWNGMISGYLENARPRAAFEMFQKMDIEGSRPCKLSFIAAVYSLAGIGLDDIKCSILHNEIVLRDFERDTFVGAAMVYMYGKCGCCDISTRVFDNMPQRNVLAWNAVVGVLADHGSLDKANELFCKMPARDSISWNVMITAHAESGLVKEAQCLFENTPCRDVVSWNALVTGYTQCGHTEQALTIFCIMDLQGCLPNKVTFLGALVACGGSVAKGRLIHEELCLRRLDRDLCILSGLISMYGKCGRLHEARNIFDKLVTHSVVVWNSMVAAYAHNGHAKEALEIFRSMHLEAVCPDEVTFISTMVACGHSGMFRDGCDCWTLMCVDYGFKPSTEHYVCFVDLLCRAGQILDAQKVMALMPCEPDAVAWTSLLSACGACEDDELAIRVASKVAELEPRKTGSYSLLLNILQTTRFT